MHENGPLKKSETVDEEKNSKKSLMLKTWTILEHVEHI